MKRVSYPNIIGSSNSQETKPRSAGVSFTNFINMKIVIRMDSKVAALLIRLIMSIIAVQLIG